jgi:hypothetical protein
MQLQDIAKVRVVQKNTWCTLCCKNGHHRDMYSMLGSYTTTSVPNPFIVGPKIEWCEICSEWGHIPLHFPTLHKYHKIMYTPFCEFFKSMGHYVNKVGRYN